MKIWDPRQKDSPVAVIEPAEGEAKRDAWTACFGIIPSIFLHSYQAILTRISNLKVTRLTHMIARFVPATTMAT